MTAARAGIARIVSVTRTVPDLERAALFYRVALGFVAEGAAVELPEATRVLLGVETGQAARLGMRLGQQHITLLQFTPSGRAYPPGSTSTDLWFQHCAIVVGDMVQAYDQVMQAGAVPISDRPQHLPANTGGVTAFKFRDPFGHPLELLHLPAQVGDPVWHEPGQPLHRGIDHTAVAVADRIASVRFYGDLLGLGIDGQTHNRGLAQTRLDAVPDDDVDVVALVPGKAPPHLELLAYRTGPRRALAMAAATDAAVSRTIASGPVDAISDRLTRHGHPFRRGSWENAPAIGFDDPDGHAWICCAG